MKCTYCGKEWKNENSNLTNCPFCGESLTTIQEDSQITMASTLKQIVNNYGVNVLSDQRRCMSMFKDMAPQLKNEQKILEMAFKLNVTTFLTNSLPQEQEVNIQKSIQVMDKIFAEDMQKEIIFSFITALDWNKNLLDIFYKKENLIQSVSKEQLNANQNISIEPEVTYEGTHDEELTLFTQFDYCVREKWALQYFSFEDFEEWFYDEYGYDFYVENDRYGKYNNRVAFYLRGDSDINNDFLEGYLEGTTLILKATIEDKCLIIRKVDISKKKLDFDNNRRKSLHVTFIDEYDDYLSTDCDYLNKLISKLAVAKEQKKEVQKRIKNWYTYVKVLKEKAEEENVYLDYSGYQISDDFKNVEFIILDASQLNGKKRLYNANVKYRQYGSSDYEEYNEQDLDNDYESIGKYVRYKPQNKVLIVELDDEWFEVAKQNKLDLPEYGKLFISNLGDLAQANRLQNGLKQLENGKAKNPNLENVLFAEKVIVDNVDNQYSFDESTMLMKELNYYQKKAVEKALKAKDLFLIQGPPGTGKTTVIAEICYQDAAKGLKTLVASQSNLAVDNALSRLKADPKIRILRKGNASRVEEEGIDFTEDRVIDRWLQDTSNLCKEEVDVIQGEYSSQVKVWEELKEKLKQTETSKNDKEREADEKSRESATLHSNFLQLNQELNKLKNDLSCLEPEHKRLLTLKTNYETLKAKIKEINDFIEPNIIRRNEILSEQKEVESLIQEQLLYQKGIEDGLKSKRTKSQSNENDLAKIQSDKGNLEQLSSSYEEAKREYVKNENNIRQWERDLQKFESDYKTYAVLAKIIKEKKKNIETLAWYEDNYSTEYRVNVIRVLGDKIKKATALTASANAECDIETNAGKIIYAVEDYIRYATTLIPSILDQEIAHNLRTITGNLKDFINNLKSINNRFEYRKMVDDLYDHMTDVANDFEIDIRFLVVENKTSYNNADSIDELRLQAQNVMLDKPGKIKRLFGLTGAWKNRFLEVMGRVKRLKQQSDQEKDEITDKINLSEGVVCLQNHYRNCQLFYQQILPGMISKEREKIVYAETELKRIGYDNQESTILSTFMNLDEKVRLLRQSKQNAEKRLSELKPIIDSKQEKIRALGFDIYEKIEFLKEQDILINSQLGNLQNEINKDENLLKKVKNDIALLRSKVNVKNIEIDRLEKEVEPDERKLVEAKTDYNNIEQEITSFDYDVYERIEWLQTEINTKETNRKEFEEKIGIVDLDSQQLENKVNQIKRELDDLKRQIPTLKRKITMEAPERKLGIKLKRLNFLKTWIQRLQEPKPEEKKGLKQLYIDQANVIGITCVQSGSKAFTQDYPDFDVVIIDEVSKATPPELLLPMLKARKLILVGDHKQLPPMIGDDTLDEVVDGLDYSDEEKEETKNYFKTSVFEKLFEADSIPDENKASLVVQYRMHSNIMDTINQFYKDNEASGLICGIEDKFRNHGFDCHYIKPTDHVLWYNFPIVQEYHEMHGESGKSYYNDAEIDQVMNILFDMNQDIIKRKNKNELEKEYKKTVGVISFYAEQVKKLNSKIRGKAELWENLSIRIGTVDRFQGMERDVIIASFVRNNNSGRIGFAKEFRRVNVALSRARELLVIVGCADLFCDPDHNRNKEAAEMYANVLQEVKLHNGFRNSVGMTI